MKAVILAGGLGTRIMEETTAIPKPMVEIGDRPIIWHIMNRYAHYGVTDFIVCLGYKGHIIKNYFMNYRAMLGDITVDIFNDKVEFHYDRSEPWKITLVDTGVDSMTGGRIKAIQNYVNEEDAFFLTYGDGLCDVDISKLLEFHKKQGTHATLTAVSPPERFGVLEIDDADKIVKFKEKVDSAGTRINAGYFVLSPKVFEYIPNEKSAIWEQDSLPKLASSGQLSAYKHNGFWQCMDTMRDKVLLEKIWASGDAPWK